MSFASAVGCVGALLGHGMFRIRNRKIAAGIGALALRGRAFAEREREELIHVPEHLVGGHASPSARRLRAERSETRLDAAANDRIVKHRHGEVSWWEPRYCGPAVCVSNSALRCRYTGRVRRPPS